MTKDIKILNLTMMLALSVIMLVSCSTDSPDILSVTDNDNNPEISGIGDRKFIVSFSLNGENTTRTGTSAKSPIQSLHYYVYNVTDSKLVKKRRIRGIGDDTTWPLKRENMSWEMRQDLQDTLYLGTKYRILFIANVDSTLFDKIEKENKITFQHPIINDGNYKTVRLVLPYEGFKDHNMYFMWEGLLDATNFGNQTEHKIETITLKRVVSRTEFSRLNNAESDQHLYEAIDKGFYSTGSSNFKAINEITRERTNSYLNAVISKTSNTKFPEECKLFHDFLNKETTRTVIYETLKRKLIDKFVGEIKKLDNYTKHSYVWQAKEKAHVNYTANKKQADVLYLDGMKVKNEDLVIKNDYEINSNGSFFITGFTDNDMQYNNIQSLSFYDNTNKEVAYVKDALFQISQPLNTWYNVVCDPIDKIILNTNAVREPESYDAYRINMHTLFKGAKVSSDMTWEQLMAVKKEKGSNNYQTFNDFVNNNIGKIDEHKVTLENFDIYFGISKLGYDDGILPDLSTPEKIKILPSWTNSPKQ